ncbi:MAG: polysaccharide pyruvyl transferase family protein [Acutalibacteraceae bacterium]
MKLGIVTYHRALNYGAVLQAFALQKYLKSMGIESDIIDYRSEFIEHFYKPIKANVLKNPKTFVREVAFAPNNKNKRKKFDAFINRYLQLSEPIFSERELETLNDKYDGFISGSDQVWNLKWSGLDKAFFLNFACDEKKFSYAASFGFEKIPVGQEQIYRELLQRFQKLSVREKTGKQIIADLLGRNSEVSLDPTLLLTKNDWESVAKKPDDSGYVLLYTLEKSEELNNYAKALAEKNNTKVVYIADAIKRSKEYSYRGFLSPAEFVGLFANAGFVVTNSFHGLMFSVIFEKPFCLKYQQTEGAPNSRLIDFVNDFGLESRVMKTDSIEESDTDYNSVKELISEKRADSKKYFESIKKFCNNKIVLPISKEKCCGCRACEQICPNKAINMVADDEGFLYPVINRSLCISCGKCVNACSFSKTTHSRNTDKTVDAFVGYLKEDEKRLRSRSGGVFVAVSDAVLEDGGIVYGAKFNDNLTVSHGRATTKTERNAFCGSKYVQSNTESTYSQVYSDLKENKKVLFSGTACQVAGLKSYLKNRGIKDTANNLITMDVVCHGVVSPKLWKDNLTEVERTLGEKIISADFRDKSFGWDSHIETYTGKSNKISSERYTAIFYSHMFLRPSCYVCPYASTNRISDITLADAWGIKRVAPEWDTSKGVSFVLVNTDLGRTLIERVNHELEYKKADLNQLMQPNLENPTNKPGNRELFWSEYNTHGYTYIADKCVEMSEKIKKNNQRKAAIVKILRKLHLK